MGFETTEGSGRLISAPTGNDTSRTFSCRPYPRRSSPTRTNELIQTFVACVVESCLGSKHSPAEIGEPHFPLLLQTTHAHSSRDDNTRQSTAVHHRTACWQSTAKLLDRYKSLKAKLAEYACYDAARSGRATKNIVVQLIDVDVGVRHGN